MSFTQSKLSYYHTFTKLPVEDGLPLGSAINKAGHTVSATEVWTSEIPYFGKMASTADITAKVTPYAKENDMVQLTTGAEAGNIYRRNSIDKEGKNFSDLWEEISAEFVDGAKFKNANGDEVLIYHANKQLELLNEGNNANITSKNNASRLWVGEGNNRRLVEQFVGVTDRSLNGLASVAYAPIIKKGTADQVAGTDYYDYCVSGTVLWASANTTTSYITCFEYIGPKVSVSIENLQDAMKVVQDTIENGVVSSVTANSNTVALGISVDNTDETKPVIKAEGGTIAATETKFVTGKAVYDYIAELHKVPQFQTILVENPAEKWEETPEIQPLAKDTIYLVKEKPNDSAFAGGYIEYLAYEKDGVIITEKIGTTTVDLSDYATKDFVSGEINTKTIQSASGDTYVSATKNGTELTISTKIGEIDSYLATNTASSVKGAIDAKVSTSTFDTTVQRLEKEIEAAAPPSYVKSVEDSLSKTVYENYGPIPVPSEYSVWEHATKFNEDGTIEILNLYVPDSSDYWFEICGKPNMYSNFTADPEITINEVIDYELFTEDGQFRDRFESDKIIIGGRLYIGGTYQEHGMFYISAYQDGSWSEGPYTRGSYGCTTLKTFKSPLTKLKKGSYMFKKCSGLETFISDMPSLWDGYEMFTYCSSLKNFMGDLSSLAEAEKMFKGCKLSDESLMYIADSINTVENKSITIDVDDVTSEVAKEYLEDIARKGWTVATNHTAYSPAASSIIAGHLPLFVIARPAESGRAATHRDSEGNLFAMESAVSVIGPEQNKWQIFASEADAEISWGLTRC